MGHEVCLTDAGGGSFQSPQEAPALPAASRSTHFREQAIHCHRADRQQLVAKLAIKI
ncbi:hypothetical protein QN219_31560 [Sinorhizobium sp. 7-81]|uniref:hypothetical protein n=1 Tax=Sinorhizobium sp. 8-89 TaxID=3049089 RepID=UPI0024C221A5|nr:hypothetical protein [Sinorhizobium sp. 8-89]MDK1494474.1 hypothetical protein [Sinorhizobium sp. 8-89]